MKIIKIGAIWCPGCLVMKKVWQKVLNVYPNLDILELDLDMDSTEVSKYNPGSILPITIFTDNNGIELERLTGEVKDIDIIERIKKYGEVNEKDN